MVPLVFLLLFPPPGIFAFFGASPTYTSSPRLHSSSPSALTSQDSADITTTSQTTRRMVLQLIKTLPVMATVWPSSATSLDAVLSVPPQTKQTTWPLGKVAFSLLPLAGSYSRRATGKIFYSV